MAVTRWQGGDPANVCDEHTELKWGIKAAMLLIGLNRSPYTRRVAITLKLYDMPFEQRALSGFSNRAEVRAWNPLGRIPALVLDSGEVLVDSGAIIDHLDEAYGRDHALTPAAGADRRAVLKVAATMMAPATKAFRRLTS